MSSGVSHDLGHDSVPFWYSQKVILKYTLKEAQKPIQLCNKKKLISLPFYNSHTKYRQSET